MASRPRETLDDDSVKKEASYEGSSGSESKQDSADPASVGFASAPAYAQPRKRASRAGTRSVTTLSAAQLERKRANDREAQRAIRARTKEHIEQLERRLLELSTNGDQSEQLLASMKRNRELEEENAILRQKLQQAHYSLGIPADPQDTAWSNSPSLLRHPVTNGNISMISHPQLQTNIPPPSRHQDAPTSHFGNWQDAGQTFGSPSSMRRGGPSPTTFQSDMSSISSAGGSRRENVSPGGVTPGSVASATGTQGMEYSYRPALAPQYGSIPDAVSQQHHMGGEARMPGLHSGQPAMTTYGAPQQQHQQHQQQQHPQHPQQHQATPSSQQQPRFMPFQSASAANPGPHPHQPQAQPSSGQTGFTSQNQQQQQMYYGHPGYGQ